MKLSEKELRQLLNDVEKEAEGLRKEAALDKRYDPDYDLDSDPYYEATKPKKYTTYPGGHPIDRYYGDYITFDDAEFQKYDTPRIYSQQIQGAYVGGAVQYSQQDAELTGLLGQLMNRMDAMGYSTAPTPVGPPARQETTHEATNRRLADYKKSFLGMKRNL